MYRFRYLVVLLTFLVNILSMTNDSGNNALPWGLLLMTLPPTPVTPSVLPANQKVPMFCLLSYQMI